MSLIPRLRLIYGDLNDASSLNKILRDVQPDEIYNLGAQSHVMVSFDIPEYTGEVTGLGTVRLLEAIRETQIQPKFYQASSSELYGLAQETPQKETTPFYPRSPYACAKAYAFYMVRNYREAYGLFACNGILFNHESPRRGETFVSRKITRAATRISVGLQDKLYLGNLEARRDWGYAPEYVEAMWLMLQQETARRLCHCHRGNSLRQRICRGGVQPARIGLAEARGNRPALYPSHGSRSPSGRLFQSRKESGMEAQGSVQGSGADHGRSRPRAGQARSAYEQLQGAGWRLRWRLRRGSRCNV